MKIFIISAVIFISVCGVFAQEKTFSASEVAARFQSGKDISIENARIIGDLDLTNFPNQINDAVYREKGKTAKVFSSIFAQNVSFKNVKFAGNVIFFRKEENEKEIFEYRIQFKNTVKFENCTFEKDVNFELTNFDNGVSFAGSVFKQKPLFIRIGLEKSADFTGTVFEQKAVFQFTQNSGQKTLSAAELQELFDKLKGH
ncbi:MAG: pentapeptide repeat-containing protein [Pyrinomonadaceae bacterium]|nr:pentapeptide repeat-containing protein [Pyrinomonadaceae bacterium]